MILTLIFAGMVVISVVCLSRYDKTDNDVIFEVGVVFSVVGGILLAIAILCIVLAHIGVDVEITKNNIRYESLCERHEIITSDYEDVSRSEVIKDIAEWNEYVYGYRYWTYNPWTSWFNSKKVADNLKTIE